ncbi:MAG: hypothetical protein HQL67_01925 [Magnetococcales bacterium]|nr:hypothetical protein [Magnetococcales bacterium]
MKRLRLYLAGITLTTALTFGAGTVKAGTLTVPHNKQDRVIVYTYTTLYAHPIDYWWHLNPSESGSWDYFSPVDSIRQPIALEAGTIPTYGTPRPEIRLPVKRSFSSDSVYGNPAVTGTPPAYQQTSY